MRTLPKIVSRTVGVLKNPDPKYVSIVTHGANQTPFSSVKSTHQIKGEKPMPIVKRNAKKTDKTPAKKSAEPKTGTGVLKVTFKKAQFATEADVTAWLDENQWEGYSISDENGEFVAKSDNNDESDFAALSPVDVQDGVEAVVGKFKTEAAKSDDDEGGEGEDDNTNDDVEGEDADESEDDVKEDGEEGDDTDAEDKEPAVKLDYWNMWESKGKSVADVLKDGMSDGVPPGAGEIMAATNYAIGNVLGGSETREAKRASLNAIGTEMADMLANVYEVFDEATTTKSKSVNVVKFVGEFNDFVATAKADKAMDNEDGKAKDKTKDKPAKKSDLQVPAKKTDDKDDAEKTGGIDMEALGALIGGAVEKATAPLSQALDGLSKKVDTAVKASESATKVAGEAAKTVKEMASQPSNTRKSSSQEEPQGTKKKGPTEAEVARKADQSNLLRGLTGL